MSSETRHTQLSDNSPIEYNESSAQEPEFSASSEEIAISIRNVERVTDYGIIPKID